MNERKIKDLSIALEALSRINGYEFEKLSSRVRDLLDDLLIKEEQAQPKPSTDANDEIPF